MIEPDPALDSLVYCFRCDKPTYSRHSHIPGRSTWHCRECGGLTDEFYPDEEDDHLWKPMTPEEADRAFDEAEEIPVSKDEIEKLVSLAVSGIPETVRMPEKTPYNSANGG